MLLVGIFVWVQEHLLQALVSVLAVVCLVAILCSIRLFLLKKGTLASTHIWQKPSAITITKNLRILELLGTSAKKSGYF